MSTTTNTGSQFISFDFKAPLKGDTFNQNLYSIIKPGIYKGLDISIAVNNITGHDIDISRGQAFLNCLFEAETKRSVKVEFQTNISTYTIPQTTPNVNETVYILFEYKKVVENWVAIGHCAANTSIPNNAIILAELVYDISGNITSISYSNRDWGLVNLDADFSMIDTNEFSNADDFQKRFRFSASGITSNETRVIDITDYNYSLNTITDWTSSRNYKINEVIVYENTLFRCITSHTSNPSFYTDLSKWENIITTENKEVVNGYNNSGSQINSGLVVTIVGDYPTEEIPEIDLISDYLQEPFGIVVNNISNANSGEVIQRGRIELSSYDFSSGVVGQKVYCDENGNLTLTVTPLIVGQLLDPINSIIYVSILPSEEGIDTIDFNGQLSTNEDTIQKALDRLDDFGYLPIWVTNKTYRIGNGITKDGIIYTCLVNHTSGTFSTDLTANRWLKVQSYLDTLNLNGQLSSNESSYQLAIERLDDFGYIPDWTTSTEYRVGNPVNASGNLYICNVVHTSGVFLTDLSTKWLKVQNYLDITNLNGQLNSNENTYQKVVDRLDDFGYMPIWVTGKDYRIGNSFTYQNVPYIVLINHTSGIFNTDLINGNFTQLIQSESVFSNLQTVTTSGVINDLNVSGTSIIRLTNATNLNGIVNPSGVKVVTIVNATGNILNVNFNSGSASQNDRILTGTSQTIRLLNTASINLFYDTTSNKWRVIGTYENQLITNPTIVIANYSISVGEMILCNSTSASGINITLPSEVKTGDRVCIIDQGYMAETYPIVLVRNGNKIHNIAENFNIDINGVYIELIYDENNTNWIVKGIPNLVY